MTDAANAMRRHATQMLEAIQLAQTDLSEEERLETGAKLAASFSEAEGAWNVYREHLIQHGILSAAGPVAR
jgi:hypothetical protein